MTELLKVFAEVGAAAAVAFFAYQLLRNLIDQNKEIVKSISTKLQALIDLQKQDHEHSDKRLAALEERFNKLLDYLRRHDTRVDRRNGKTDKDNAGD